MESSSSPSHAEAPSSSARRTGDARDETTTVWLEEALDAALDAIGTAALVSDRNGHVVIANDAGRQLYLAEGAKQIARAISDARRGRTSRFEVRALRRDARGYVLAVLRPDNLSTDERLERAGARYGLSTAQTGVLKLVSRGMSNLDVAAALGISERTVEAHVTKILAKLAVTSRAAAVARALGDDDGA